MNSDPINQLFFTVFSYFLGTLFVFSLEFPSTKNSYFKKSVVKTKRLFLLHAIRSSKCFSAGLTCANFNIKLTESKLAGKYIIYHREIQCDNNLREMFAVKGLLGCGPPLCPVTINSILLNSLHNLTVNNL